MEILPQWTERIYDLFTKVRFRFRFSSFFPRPDNNNSSNTKYQKITPPLPRFVVVLLHSPEADASQTNRIKKVLEEQFGEDVMVIQIKCIKGLKEIELSTAYHAEQIHTEILSSLANAFNVTCTKDFKKNLDLPIHIFGYNQNKLMGALSPHAQLKIKTLYASNTIDHQDTIKAYNEDQIILDYINFLTQQQENTQC